MPDTSRSQDTTEHEIDRAVEARVDRPNPEESPASDEPGWDVWFATLIPCLGLAALGGIVVASEHGFVLGAAAALMGLVVGQLVAMAIAATIDSNTTTDPEWRRLADLPAEQRVGEGLRTRRKEKPLDVAKELLSIAIVFLAAPAATLLTALSVGWIAPS